MKRFLLFVAVATLFAACSKDGVNEISNDRGHAIPSVLYASIDTEDETRIQLDELQKTVWTEGDLVSVFYYCNGNTPFEFKGKTGDRDGKLGVLSLVEGDTEIDKIVSIYPYSEAYTMNTTKKYVSVKLPATQHYLEGSYGVGDNLMAYVGDDDSNLSHKNLCGWIKIQLKGSGIVTKITLKGNDGEQLAGDAKFYYEDFRLETLDQGGLAIGEYIETITLDCGKGVTLDAETPTEFYFVVAPHTFAKGITIEATCSDGTVLTKSTSNKLTVERNHIKPMAALPVDATILANNKIWYTNGSTTEPTAPCEPAAFGNATIQSNTYDVEKECWVITFDKDIKEIGNYAFNSCGSLTSVTIGDSVTTIGDSAFRYCYSLTSVTIGNGVTTIGDGAFSYCDSLKEFKGKFAADGGRCLIIDGVLNAFALGCGAMQYTIPDSVTTIGRSAFNDCDSLTSVTIPNSVTTIGEMAFCFCESLTSVTIPDSVTTIGWGAFEYCDSLTSVTIPDSVTTIGNGAFSSCYRLKEFKGKFAADNGRCLIMDNTIIAYAEASGTTYTIPDGVTTIGDSAFYDCVSLTSVNIPDSVTTIGDYAFSYCRSLATVYCKPTTPPAGGYRMFYNASDRKIYVPASDDDSIINAYKEASGWSEYKDYIFEEELKPANNKILYTATAMVEPYYTDEFGATYISNDWDSETGKGVITFEGDVTKIGNYAFYKCSSLKSVTIPDSVTTIGYAAFAYCDSLKSVTIPDSVTTIGDWAFGYCESLTSVTIGDSVTTIGERAFGYCESLTSVTIPDSVTTIGEKAFCDCYSLTSVTIGDSVTTIGEKAFCDCYSLTSVTIGNGVTKIGEWAFAYCSSLTSVTIPDSVTTIGEGAFAGCTITSVTIPDSVTTIGDSAFRDCDSLKEFKGKFAAYGGRCLIIDGVLNAFALGCGATQYTIPDSVTMIGTSAFEDCYSLTSVTIPDSVTTIGEYAFQNCTSLTSVTIPESVTTIGNFAFCDCRSLKAVYCKPTTPPTGGSSMFNYNASDRKIYVPASDDNSIINAYKEASGWSEYKDYIYEDEPKPANNEIWYTNGSTTEPTAPYTPAAFGDATIQSNTYDAEKECWVITFNKDVTTIGKSAFYNCRSLTSVTIGDSVTTIGYRAFYDCTNLTSVTIGDSVTTIRGSAFYRCSNLTSVTIPDSVTTIGNHAFEDCESLTSVTIGDGVTTIEHYAFSECTSLTSVTIPDSVITIGAYAFEYCDSLTSVTIGDGVTTIGRDAFRECRSLKSVTIGDSVTTIGDYAFYNCISLKIVHCKPTTPPTGGYMMFKYYNGQNFYRIVCDIIVPVGSGSRYKAAEYWSDYAYYISEESE